MQTKTRLVKLPRGAAYATNPTNNLLGYNKAYARNKHKATGDALRLLVKGTLDTLDRGFFRNSKLTEKEHPTDKGYFKKVFVLNDNGKRALRMLKAKRDAKESA